VGAHYDAARLPDGRVTGGVMDNGAAAVILTRVAETLRGHTLRGPTTGDPMSASARSLGWLFGGCLLLSPLEANGQDPVSGDILRTLSLDSLGGEVPVYFSPGQADRARALQQAYGGAVAHYRVMFGGGGEPT
jgi:hypothetical protein